MSAPVTTVLERNPRSGHDVENVIIRFKGKQYRVQKNGPNGPGLNVYIFRKSAYYILKTLAGEGIFKDMLKNVEGVSLPPGFRVR